MELGVKLWKNKISNRNNTKSDAKANELPTLAKKEQVKLLLERERVWKNWYHFRSLFFLFIPHKFILTFLNLHQLKSTLFKILHFILSTFNYTHICKVPTESRHRIHVHMYSLSLWDWILSAEDIYDTLHSLLCSWTNLLDILNHDCGKQINDDVMKLREK